MFYQKQAEMKVGITEPPQAHHTTPHHLILTSQQAMAGKSKKGGRSTQAKGSKHKAKGKGEVEVGEGGGGGGVAAGSLVPGEEIDGSGEEDSGVDTPEDKTPPTSPNRYETH